MRPGLVLTMLSMWLPREGLAQPAPTSVTPTGSYAPSAPVHTLMIGGAVTIGGTDGRDSGDPSYFSMGFYLEGAFLLASLGGLDLRARGFGSAGPTIESDWTGSARRLGGGAEARICSPARGFCAFGGADLGYQSLDLIDSDGNVARAHKGLTVDGRVGFDVGRRARFRCALEETFQRSGGGFFDMTFVFVGLALER